MIPTTASFNTANAAPAKQPIYLVSIAGYSRVFTTVKTGVSGQYAWVREDGISGYDIRADDLNGSSNVGDLSVTVLDVGRQITADLVSGTLAGRALTLTLGYPGMLQTDFAVLGVFTIYQINNDDVNNTYTLVCRNQDVLENQIVFRQSDDALALGASAMFPGTANDHPRTIVGNPMDILLYVLQNANELALPNSAVNLAAIANYKNGIFSGMRMEFHLTTAPQAMQWLALEIFKPLGGYSFWNSQGQFTPFFWVPYVLPASGFSLTDKNIKDIPVPTESALVNVVTARFDQDVASKQQATELVEIDGVSFSRYGTYGQQVIESRGLRSFFGAWSWLNVLSNSLFKRYGYNNQFLQVTVFWTAVVLEPGDYVSLTSALVPNRQTGSLGITNRLYEVLERTWDFTNGLVGLKLLDVSWWQDLSQSTVAVDGTAVWTLATQAQRNSDAFVANNTSGKFSDGFPGKAYY